MKCKIAFLIIVFFILTACGADVPGNTCPSAGATPGTETTQTEIEPFLQPSILEIPANERCAATGNCKFAETDLGYYMVRYGYLFYADKSDLGNWVLVCNEPDCSHEEGFCPGHLGSLCGIWIQNNSIYYVSDRICDQYLDGYHIIKMGLDGSSPTPVYTHPALNGNYSGGGGLTDASIDGSFCRCIATLQEDGNWNCSVVQVNTNGTKVLFSADYPPSSNGSLPLPWTFNSGYSIRGDVVVNCNFTLDTNIESKEDWADQRADLFYQITNDTIREIKLHEDCDLYGAYISGDSLWHYHMNDGFYYMDLSTGEEVKIADAAYENAYGHCVDGKHMVECSMSVPGYSRDSTEAKMRYFDGEVWHELELPEHWNAQYKFRVWAGASDRIIFTVDSDEKRSSDRQQELGYIMLGEAALTICDKYPTALHFD